MGAPSKTNTDLLPPGMKEVLGELAKITAISAALARLRESLSKRAKSKKDLNQIGKEVEELQGIVETMVELLQSQAKCTSKLSQTLTEFVTSLSGIHIIPQWEKNFGNLTNVATIITHYEERLKSLESSVASVKTKGTHKI